MSNKIIKINRGDSFEFALTIPNKSNPFEKYTLDEAKDVVYFVVMYPHQPFEKAFLMQGYTFEDQDPATGEIIIKLAPNDTRSIEPGVYYYTVKLQRGGTIGVINDLDNAEEVRTIIERTKFIVND
jgi:hypothetical protein